MIDRHPSTKSRRLNRSKWSKGCRCCGHIVNQSRWMIFKRERERAVLLYPFVRQLESRCLAKPPNIYPLENIFLEVIIARLVKASMKWDGEVNTIVQVLCTFLVG